MRLVLASLLVAACCGAAAAQQQTEASGEAGPQTMGALVAQGYEIKAAAPNAGKFVVWVQKGEHAYACDFATVRNARCEEIK